MALAPLNIFFDVDETLILGNGELRNHAREALEAIDAMGHHIYVWSGVGIRRWDMKRHGLHDLVSGYFVKPLHDYRARLDVFKVEPVPDFVVDDMEAVVDAFGGYHVRTDVTAEDDQELLIVVQQLRAQASPAEPARA
jgi:hypothetical protein